MKLLTLGLKLILLTLSMDFKMKKRILLPLMFLATLVSISSCSSDLTDHSGKEKASKEKMLTLSVTAGTGEEPSETRAFLEERSGSGSLWKWETGDKLLLVTKDAAGQKNVFTLTVNSSAVGKSRGVFTGSIPASAVVDGNSYRFFYVGKTTDGTKDRTITGDDINAGKITVDLSSQTGNLTDIKKHCVLSGEGKIFVSGSTADVKGRVNLANAFTVAHFAMKAENGATITKVGIRGEGVYTSASVDLETGLATGVSEIGIELDPETNIFLPAGKTDFYITLVPGRVTPSFDGYYADSYSSVITATPESRDYAEEKSFVYFNNAKAAFSVSDNKKVAITNGNMQYVMPVKTYTANMKPNTLEANKLIRWRGTTPLNITGKATVHPGYYRLAPEQWEMAMPRNGKTGGSYTYSTVVYNGEKYISPETYRYFDLPSWGTLNNPTLVKYKYTGPTSPQTYTETQYDYGNKLEVGSKKTRVLTAEEWEYLFSNGAYNNSKRTWGNGTPKWAKCFIDENGDKVRSNSQPAELRGFLIFPDNMPIEEAKKVFTRNENKFGNESNSSLNATTYEKIKKSGAVFLPLTAYRNEGQAKLNEWGQHGNYSTSTYQNIKLLSINKGMYHVRFTINGIVFSDYTVPGQGCASRLVQDINE